MGEASHIYAAAEHGPRPNPSLTDAQRSAASNGIHFCKVHAKLIDLDTNEYTAEKLTEIKLRHERSIRALVVRHPLEFDPGFLDTHDTQVVHGRGSPTLGDLWVPRHLAQFQLAHAPLRREAAALIAKESGILLISGDQWSGRTSLLKRMAATFLTQRKSAWPEGRELTPTVLRDPVPLLAAAYQRLYADTDGWQALLDGDRCGNLIFVDDLHLSPLNMTCKRKLLCLLHAMADSVVVTVSATFLVEILAAPTNDALRVTEWRLLDLTRADCADMVKRWCGFGAEEIPDHELDSRIANTQDQVDLIFGKNLMPRQPLFVITALQMVDAGAALDTSVGSYGGVYEMVIHLAISKNARNQAAIANERVYLEELAYWCESNGDLADRYKFNAWFAERKAITPNRVAEIESSVSAKGFLARHHSGFRFNYQKYYFIASFIRNNPNRGGVQEYIRKLVSSCWNEDYANTAMFLAYLQPSSFLIEALLSEMKGVFADHPQFEIRDWKLQAQFPEKFFQNLTLSNDAEGNRRLLAERLDEASPVESPECTVSSTPEVPDGEARVMQDYFKAFHLIKLIGQLIRNSPIAFDAQQKEDLVHAGFSLGLRVISFALQVCNPAALQALAVAQLRAQVLKKHDRAELEAKLSGLIYTLLHFVVFNVLRHTCCYLAHPDVTLIYQRLLRLDASQPDALSYQVLGCGLQFELRSPDTLVLRKICRELTPAGQDILRTWAWLFLWYNRVLVSKRQGILQALGMTSNVQLLLPRGGDE